MKKQKTDALEKTWKLFEKTGEINYYLLYRKLKDE